VAEALTVGATTSSDARASFSNYGTCVDLFAPGQNITSSWYSSTTATNTISGTSMATPHVTGAAALYAQSHPGDTPAQVASALIGSATTGVVANPGSGSPNRLLYTGTGTGGGGGGTPTPPPGCGTTYNGSLSRTGSSQIQPNGTYYQSNASGTHKACLTGPAGADFDLYLYKWNGSRWVAVAASEGSTAIESITYTGTAGYYEWEVYSYSGSGSYTLQISHP
jgi:aqualysin 1